MPIDKVVYSLILNMMLIVLLGYAWFLGKDGAVQTAVFSIIGLSSGVIVGYQIAQKQE